MSFNPVFEIIEKNVILAVMRNPVNPEKKVTVRGDVARLGDGRLIGRSKSFDVVGNHLFSYGLWDPHARRAAMIPSRDTVADLTKIVERVEIKLGVHALSHKPPLTALEKFVAEVGPDGASMARAAGLTMPTHVSFLFDPGTVRYQKQGIANVRQIFERHVTGDWGGTGGIGGNGTWNSAFLTEEERWLIHSLPVGRQNDHCVQTGRGIIRSQYDDEFAVTIFSHSRRDTLLYSTKMMD
jgi:hypothetical protein